MQYNRVFHKKICVCLCFWLILIFLTVSCGTSQKYDAVNTDIVASVDGTLIYQEDLRKEVAHYDQITQELLESHLDALIDETIALKQAENKGLSPLTEKEAAEVTRTVEEVIDDRYQYYYTQFQEEYPQESKENLQSLTQEAIAAYVAESGETTAFLTELYTRSAILEKLQKELTAEVTVSDSEIRSRYEEYVAQDRELYSAHPEYFESDKTTNAVYYNPEGYRYVKHIRLSDRETAETVLQLAETTDFDQLMEEYTEDSASLAYPHGFAVGENSTLYIDGFAEAANALSQPGALSPGTELRDGFYIIKYERSIPAGAEDFDFMRQYVENDVLTEKRSQAYSKVLAQWREKADILIFHDVLDAMLQPD